MTITGGMTIGGMTMFAAPANLYSVQFASASSQYLTVPGTGSPFAFGTGNFTIEGWFNLTTFSTTPLIASIQSSWSVRVSTGGLVTWYIAGANIGQVSSAVTINTWNHFAVVRSGTGTNQFVIYVNGVAGYTNTRADNITNTNTLYLSKSDVSNSGYVNGYISNFRVVKGVAVYTGNFTVPTAPLAATQGAGTNISAITAGQTSLLTCQSSTFIDTSGNDLAITTANGPVTSTFIPF